MNVTGNLTSTQWEQLYKKGKISFSTPKEEKAKISPPRTKSKNFYSFSLTYEELQTLDEIRWMMVKDDIAQKKGWGLGRSYNRTSALKLILRIINKNSKDLKRKLTEVRQQLDSEDGRTTRHQAKN